MGGCRTLRRWSRLGRRSDVLQYPGTAHRAVSGHHRTCIAENGVRARVDTDSGAPVVTDQTDTACSHHLTTKKMSKGSK